MFSLEIPWWQLLVRAVIAYGALVLFFRLAGRRELGQMTPFDLVVILLIANTLQNAMVGSDSSVTAGLIAAAAVITANLVLSRFVDRFHLLHRAVEGDPLVLLTDGRIQDKNMKRGGVDRAELEQATREHGIASLDEVLLAVMEVDGSISIIPKSSPAVRTKRKFRQRRLG